MRILPHMTREIRRIDLAGPRTHLEEMTSVFLYYGILQSITRVRVACLQAVREKFGISVHRRSLERALAGKKKLRQSR